MFYWNFAKLMSDLYNKPTIVVHDTNLPLLSELISAWHIVYTNTGAWKGERGYPGLKGERGPPWQKGAPYTPVRCDPCPRFKNPELCLCY